MEELKDLLLKRMKDHHLGTEALAATVCHNINSITDGSFTAIKYKNSILTVSVASSSHASEFQARMFYWKERIKERIAPNPVTRIYIKYDGQV